MERLRQRADFLAAASGIKVPAAAFVLQARKRADDGPVRLGFTVSKKVGNAIERTATREEAIEIMVQLKSGERRAIVQAKGSESISPGDAVIIVTTGGKVRVTRAPAVAAQPTKG